ncbi:hypothetical protein RK944_02700, partial [Streptococcus pneumoniae]|nr:hypothetical protein [Streptococcus pneumoniae]
TLKNAWTTSRQVNFFWVANFNLKFGEYYPLKRAILHQENALYFRLFSNFDDFLEKNYLKTIWQVSKETPFSEMDFNMFKNISEKIIFERGSKMLDDLKSNYKK